MKHHKYELIISNKNPEITLTTDPVVKEKIHRLSVEAIVKDNLPFNAFMKSGLKKLMKEAIPGNTKLYCSFVDKASDRAKVIAPLSELIYSKENI